MSNRRRPDWWNIVGTVAVGLGLLFSIYESHDATKKTSLENMNALSKALAVQDTKIDSLKDSLKDIKDWVREIEKNQKGDEKEMWKGGMGG